MAFTDNAGLIVVGVLTLLLVEWEALQILELRHLGTRRAGLELTIAALIPAVVVLFLARLLALLPA
jgi:hypothetical protein